MKTTLTSVTNKLLTISKPLVKWASNLAILSLGISSLASLILVLGQFDLGKFLPGWLEVSRVAPNGWLAANLFVLTSVPANLLMIFGLLKLKSFVRDFELGDWSADATLAFIKKGALLMALVGLLQTLSGLSVYSGKVLLDFSVAGWLLLLSWGLTLVKNRRQMTTVSE